MRSTRSVHAAIAAIVAVGILVIGAAPAAAGGKHGKGKGETLRVVATDYSRQLIDVGAPGSSIGDYFVFFETLSVRGREVGIGAGQCVTVEGVPPYTTFTAQCVATLDLARGQITLQGLVEFQGEGEMSPFTVAITGGTGAYRGASGEARVIPRVIPGGIRIIYKLSLDSHDKKKKGRGRH